MWRVSLVLVLTVAAAPAGCTFERPPRKMIQPNYSYFQSNRALTVEHVWPVDDHRSAQATRGPANEEAIE